ADDRLQAIEHARRTVGQVVGDHEVVAAPGQLHAGVAADVAAAAQDQDSHAPPVLVASGDYPTPAPRAPAGLLRRLPALSLRPRSSLRTHAGDGSTTTAAGKHRPLPVTLRTGASARRHAATAGASPRLHHTPTHPTATSDPCASSSPAPPDSSAQNSASACWRAATRSSATTTSTTITTRG